jgi:hypothetical protein
MFTATNQLVRLRRYNEFYVESCQYDPSDDIVFVFGSNLSGIHGAGAAKTAKEKHGAVYGKAEGLAGQSYAIPTRRICNGVFITLELSEITPYVRRFVLFTENSDQTFFITPIGCGLAGYQSHHIAPMFKGAQRCYFPESWIPYVL